MLTRIACAAWRLVAVVTAASVLTGCSNMTRASQRPPEELAVIKPQPQESLTPKKGSIWQTTDRNTLFLDNKARNVGDLVTVLISETSSANKNASTSLSREGSAEVNLGGLFGLTDALAAKGNKFLKDSAKIENTFTHDGEGATSRRGSFTATVSCAVTEVLANGNLRIEGRRDITVNNENQYIVLSGVIRPEDISPSNMVRSTQVADARIEYSGDGDIDDQQSPSWLNRLFTNLRIL